MTDPAGNRVAFVARPDLYPAPPPGVRVCRPDDPADPGDGTWRDVLSRYNERYRMDGANPNGLLPAGDLYRSPVYRQLAAAIGQDNLFILSAGWGLVRADYLLPDYDVSFSAEAEPYARRKLRDNNGDWRDFNQLAEADVSPDEPVHFFGSLGYLDLYYQLTFGLSRRRIIHHKSEFPPRKLRRGYEYARFAGQAVTNWHYAAAKEFAWFFAGEPEQA